MVEPAKSRSLADLDPDFAERLVLMMGRLADEDCPFGVIEGRRSDERQQWLYGSGRPSVTFGRPGPWLTGCDGLTTRSKHQDGLAADLWPLNPRGNVYCPSPANACWLALAAAAQAVGLVSGARWIHRDLDHVEMP